MPEEDKIVLTNLQTESTSHIVGEDSDLLPYDSIPCDFDGTRVMWMQIVGEGPGEGNKEIHVYSIQNKAHRKDCVIPKDFGYLSHVKLFGSHLILVLNHQKILVLYLGFRTTRTLVGI